MKRWCPIILCFTITVVTHGQSIQEQYPFLILEKNGLEYPGGMERAGRFFDKLDKLAFTGEGQLNILHIGGSHVQAGTLSDEMRHGLQDMSPGLKGSRGFFFPYQLAETNSPSTFYVTSNAAWIGCRCARNDHHCRWGMSGINARTEDPNARVTLAAYNDREAYSFRALRIFAPRADSLFRPVADAGFHEVDTSWYDERGFTEIHFNRSYREFRFGLAADIGARAFIWQGIQYIDNWPGLSYHAIGVNGASTKSYLRCTELEVQMSVLAPDLVIFGIGLNDAYVHESRFDEQLFEQRYDSLMTRVRSANPDVLFLFVTNNDSYFRNEHPNPNALAVSRVMRRLAARSEGVVWDLFEIMGGMGSIDSWVDEGLARNDRIHLTRRGYELQAELLTRAIRSAWVEHLKKTKPVHEH